MAVDQRRVKIIREGCEVLASLGGPRVSREASVMLYAIGMQEDPHMVRAQITKWGKGPARGLWQFERGGGVAGVMQHPATKYLAMALCERRHVSFDARAIWTELEYDDVLACGFARLLLWTDKASLPTTPRDGWKCYLRVWRPGKLHPDVWYPNWQAATAAFPESA